MVVASITLLGGLVRILPIARADFPLNDGGLFAEMIQGLRANGFALPTTVDYNAADIPFAYPPLGLYVGAWLTQWFSLLDVLRFTPLLVSILTVPIGYTIYRRLLPSEAMTVVATVAFAVMARSYSWQILGGGITRSFGFLFALTAISASISMYRSKHPWWPIATGIALGLSALSHPQAALFAVGSVVLLLSLQRARWRSAVMRLALALVVAAVVVAPWFLIAFGRYGPATFLGAAQTGGSLYQSAVLFITLRFSGGLVEVLGILGGFGLFVCALNRKWLWIVWSVLAFLLGSRAGLTYATVPVAGAIAWAVADGFRILRMPIAAVFRGKYRPKRAALLAAVLLVAASTDSIASTLDPLSPLRSLSPAQRDGMRWAAEHTTPTARFLVAAGDPWELDAVSEWFWPLTGRRSVATVQGSEWLGPGRFGTAERRHYWLLNCITFTTQDCSAEWNRVVEPVDFVYLTDGQAAAAEGHPCCLQLADRIVAAGGQVVFEEENVRILAMGGR